MSSYKSRFSQISSHKIQIKHSHYCTCRACVCTVHAQWRVPYKTPTHNLSQRADFMDHGCWYSARRCLRLSCCFSNESCECNGASDGADDGIDTGSRSQIWGERSRASHPREWIDRRPCGAARTREWASQTCPLNL